MFDVAGLLASGVNTLTVTAMGRERQVFNAQTVTIDTDGPYFSALSGTLATTVGTTNQPLTADSYTLDYTATDAAAGVASISGTIDCDGVSIPTVTDGSPSPGSDLLGSFTLEHQRMPPRLSHPITLTATNAAGTPSTDAQSPNAFTPGRPPGAFRFRRSRQTAGTPSRTSASPRRRAAPDNGDYQLYSERPVRFTDHR